jgi:hypothetical protein
VPLNLAFDRGLVAQRNEWLRKIDERPHQVVLPRRQLAEEYEIMKFFYYVGEALNL